MSEEDESDEQGITPVEAPNETPSDNPLDEMGVVLSFPRTVEIEMVEARDLGDYELWFGIVSLLLSTSTGFFIAWLEAWQADPPERTAGVLLAVWIIFAGMTLLAVFVTVAKRKRLSRERQRVTFKAGRLQ